MALDKELGEKYKVEIEVEMSKDEKELLMKVIKNNFKSLTIPVDNLDEIIEVLK